jgi:hypothetical protein
VPEFSVFWNTIISYVDLENKEVAGEKKKKKKSADFVI